MSDSLKFMEDLLFDPNRLSTMSTMELISMYEAGQKVFASSMDYSRKFIFQNRDSIKQLESGTDEVKQALLRLNPDKLKKLKELIEEASPDAK